MHLTKENYHSLEQNRLYVSTSQIKSFVSCPARFKAEIDGEYERAESKALLQGQFFDSMFDGTRELFEMQNKVYKKDGSPYAEYAQTIEAYERVRADEVMFKLCSEGKQQIIMTGSVQGIPVKIMIDSLHDDIVVDRKYVRNFGNVYTDEGWQNFALAWGYDLQSALYQTVVAQNTGGEMLPFVLACVSKETPIDIGVFRMSDETIENAMGIIRSVIVPLNEVKHGRMEAERCGTCPYCVETKTISKNMEEWGEI